MTVNRQTEENNIQEFHEKWKHLNCRYFVVKELKINNLSECEKHNR